MRSDFTTTTRLLTATLACALAPACSDGPVSTPTLAPTADAGMSRATAQRPPHYTIVDLGTLGGPFSIAFDVDESGRVVGSASIADGSQHAVTWHGGQTTDLGTLGGPNSQASGRAVQFPLAILAETPELDPLGEDFCGLHSGFVCRAAAWSNGVLTALPTLGGANAAALEVNGRGEIIGAAEDGTVDASCAPPQRSHFQAVIWGPNAGEIHMLPPLPGDEVGAALKNNDKGQVVGTSGLCSNTSFGGFALGPHAVLWDHGQPVDLGNLGDPNLSVAADINNRGEVIGGAGTPDGSIHPFMWTRGTGIRDLGLLSTDPTDANNTPFAINDRGQMTGASCDATMAVCRGYLWQDGVMTDINDLLPADAPLFVLSPLGLNNRGEIVGLAVVKSTGEAHAFLALPTPGSGRRMVASTSHAAHHMALPPSVRSLLRKQIGKRRV